MLTNAPPELPGLIAASVWIASSTVFGLLDSPVVDTGRFIALTIPVVTVPSRPSGEPTAITGWPTRRLADDPRLIGVSPEMPCTRTTAMSVVGSVPTTVNSAVRPSENVTVVFGLAPAGGAGWSGSGSGAGPPGSSSGPWCSPGRPCGAGALPGLAAVATTWLLVRIKPSEDRMMPEPSSDARPRLVSSMTTLGTTLAATCSTLPIGAFEAGIPGVAPPGSAPSATEASDPWCAITDAAAPPIPADTTATATAPTVIAPARERFRGAGSGGPPAGGPA